MKKKIKIPLIVILFFLLLIVAIPIAIFNINKHNSKYALKNCSILHDEKFGGVFADISIDDFNKLGFSYGDSVNISFSSGYTLNDIPYYNGFYANYGDPLVVGYPGYEHIKISLNYGEDLWKVANLDSNQKITITLNQKEKYLTEQKSCDLHYSNEQGNTSNEQFGNFRNIQVGNLKKDILYRSASPIDNIINRASVVDKLSKNANIEYIVDLSDDYKDIEDHIHSNDFNSLYFKSLYESDKVIALSMNMQFKSGNFSSMLVTGLTAMSENNGPYLIHCVDGKDCTGFVCIVLEALSGASYQEIVDDYMLTYKNYYNITSKNNNEAYTIIKERNVDTMLRYITGLDNDNNLANVDYAKKAEEYLKSIGMSNDAISNLKEKIIQ